jgi:hypothetical protein
VSKRSEKMREGGKPDIYREYSILSAVDRIPVPVPIQPHEKVCEIRNCYDNFGLNYGMVRWYHAVFKILKLAF